MKTMTRREFTRLLGLTLLPALWPGRSRQGRKPAAGEGDKLVIVNGWVLLESDLPRGDRA